jgi:hypothetical protein
VSAPILKLRVTPKFKAALFDGTGTKARKDGLASYVDLDFTALTHLGSYDPSTQLLIAQSTVDGTFGTVTIAQVIAGAQTEQVITAGDFVVAPNDGTIQVNKTVGAATAGLLPDPALKVGDVWILDRKKDSSTNNITLTVASGKLINGYASWVIAGDGAAVCLRPLKDGTGYALV